MTNKVLPLAMAIVAILPVFLGCGGDDDPVDENDKDKVTLSPDETELYNLIMDYRDGLGLPPIPLSASLSYVAQLHVADLEDNNPTSPTCNLHSWSDQGSWTACCYTSDHAQASCMWNKPRELTDYTGNGYEIEYFHSTEATPAGALNTWKNSAGHNDVIINAGDWTMEWKAIGIGIKGKHAVVWFGHNDDPAGPPIQ